MARTFRVKDVELTEREIPDVIDLDLFETSKPTQQFTNVGSSNFFEKYMEGVQLWTSLSLDFRNQFIRDLTDIPQPHGGIFLDLKNYNQVLELVNYIMKENIANPEQSFDDLLRRTSDLIKYISQSGDHFIWSLPIMNEYAERWDENIRLEFATLEGIEIFIPNDIGERIMVKCEFCGGTKWNAPRRTHKGRGDEVMIEGKTTCRKCSRPMGDLKKLKKIT